MAVAALDERARTLRGERVPFVRARVVLAEKPTSAKPGDEALVLADGTIEGFVGGQCAESTVRSQGLECLISGDSMLLRISPEPETGQAGKTVVHNPCLSGGTLEIFLEPVLPPARVAIVGQSPIARGLISVGESLGYEVGHYDDIDLLTAAALVVASHGKREEEAIAAAAVAGVPYIGLVASPKRGRAVLDGMELAASERERIHSPAGLDIGAKGPAEIALSIFAQIIAERPKTTTRAVLPMAADPTPAAAGSAIDPVCGMTVTVDPGTLSASVEGQDYYFCCAGCRTSFLASRGSSS